MMFLDILRELAALFALSVFLLAAFLWMGAL